MIVTTFVRLMPSIDRSPRSWMPVLLSWIRARLQWVVLKVLPPKHPIALQPSRELIVCLSVVALVLPVVWQQLTCYLATPNAQNTQVVRVVSATVMQLKLKWH